MPIHQPLYKYYAGHFNALWLQAKTLAECVFILALFIE